MLEPAHFDHIVPLDHGGLNDVTNLQLRCQDCNLNKATKAVRPSRIHERYYQL